jgi:hypothetical protein
VNSVVIFTRIQYALCKREYNHFCPLSCERSHSVKRAHLQTGGRLFYLVAFEKYCKGHVTVSLFGANVAKAQIYESEQHDNRKVELAAHVSTAQQAIFSFPLSLSLSLFLLFLFVCFIVLSTEQTPIHCLSSHPPPC